MIDLGDGWKGRKTELTRVAFRDEGGATIVYACQGDHILIAQADNVTPAVLEFLFADTIATLQEKKP
jgi:hypothetical protein